MAKISQKKPLNLQLSRLPASVISLFITLGGLGINSVYAQQAPTAGTVLEAIKEPKTPFKPTSEIAIPSFHKSALNKPLPGLKVKVTAFKITGISVFSEASLLNLISDQIGKELDFEALGQVAEKIVAYYRSKGYFLAQAYLPAQKTKDGIVEITVLEGRVGEVKLNMSKKTRLRESKAVAILGAIQPGDLINQRTFERALLLLSDIPGIVVKSALEPGAKVGSADAIVMLDDNGKRISGSVDMSNFGSRFTGEYLLAANLDVNNLTGYGDLLSVRALTSNGGGSPMGRLSYVIPVNSLGTKLAASYSEVDYALNKDFKSLQAHGMAKVTSVQASHPFIRTRNLNVYGIFGYDKKRLEDLIDTTHSIDNKDLQTYKAGISGVSQDGTFGGGLSAFSLTTSSGNVDITTTAMKNLDQGTTGYKTLGSFNKINYEYQRIQALKGNTSLYMALFGQAASKNLVSSEKFSLGGPNGVRAYPVGEASADEGVLLNTELRWNIPRSNFMLRGFVDGGSVRLNRKSLPTDGTNHRNIWGYGVGLNMSQGDSYLLRASIAWRGNSKLPQVDSDRNPRAWVQLTKSF